MYHSYTCHFQLGPIGSQTDSRLNQSYCCCIAVLMHQSNSEDSSCNCELLADPVRVHFIRFKGAQSQSFMIV